MNSRRLSLISLKRMPLTRLIAITCRQTKERDTEKKNHTHNFVPFPHHQPCEANFMYTWSACVCVSVSHSF